jgi:hypothetical protein
MALRVIKKGNDEKVEVLLWTNPQTCKLSST